MLEITSREIMDAIGIENSATLTRWHQMGLIPPPTTRTHPAGRGKMAYWPEWVLQRCVQIKQLRKAGNSLDEIKDLLSSDWTSESHKHKRRYVFSKVRERMDRDAALENLREVVSGHLQDWMTRQQHHLRSTRVPLIAIDVVEIALAMIQQGLNPVMVLAQESVAITADFVVSQYLADFRAVEDAVFVVPLFGELSSYFRGKETVPVDPTIRPSNRVIVSSGNDSTEHLFVVLQEWQYEISARGRRHTGK